MDGRLMLIMRLTRLTEEEGDWVKDVSKDQVKGQVVDAEAFANPGE